MSKYKKRTAPMRPSAAYQNTDQLLLGMLYVVEVRMIHTLTNEIRKHRLLLVGCEHDDIERKLRWIFDSSEYRELSIGVIQKVREKVHFLSTVIVQPDVPIGPFVERDEGTQIVPQQQVVQERYDPKLFAVGITTTMLAKDELHAMRKVANALLAQASEGQSHSAPRLSEDSTIAIEEIPRSSGYALPRNVGIEANRAHFVRG